MVKAHLDSPSALPTGRLTRRRAIAQASVGIASIGSAVALGLPSSVSAQDATPADEPDMPGSVTSARVAMVIDRIPALVQDILDQTGVPGMSVAVVYDDALIYGAGFGVREIGSDAGIDVDTVFQIASVSKPIASTVVSALVGRGAVEWSSRMADLDSSFALPDSWPTREVTLADLFAHRSGLPGHAGDLLEDLGFGREEILHRLRYLEPAYSFRDGYEYTNFGLTAAAVAAAGAVGMSWEDLSEEILYQPLGMTRTSSRFADYMAQENRAIPHVPDGDRWIVTPTQREPDAQTPAGGVSSTARDLAQWMRLQLGQGEFGGWRLMPPEAIAPTHIPQSVSSLPQNPATQRAGFYGLGIGVGYDDFGGVRWSHSGAFALGAATAVFMLPGSGFGVLALTNGFPLGAPEALCLSVLDLAQRGETTRDWLETVAPTFAAIIEPTYGTGTDWDAPSSSVTQPKTDDAYLGIYHNDYYGDIVITSAEDGLVMEIGPDMRAFPLAHYDRDTFSWQPPGENALIRSGLSFIIGADGTAVAFDDEYLTSGGPGTLRRIGAGA